MDVNLWNCTRCELPPLSDSFFDSDTELNRSKRSSQCDELEDNDIDSLDRYQSNISGYYKLNIKIGYLNINSVVNKIDEVKELLNRNMFDILFLAETKMTVLFHRTWFHTQVFALFAKIVRRGLQVCLPIYSRPIDA